MQRKTDATANRNKRVSLLACQSNYKLIKKGILCHCKAVRTLDVDLHLVLQKFTILLLILQYQDWKLHYVSIFLSNPRLKPVSLDLINKHLQELCFLIYFNTSFFLMNE